MEVNPVAVYVDRYWAAIWFAGNEGQPSTACFYIDPFGRYTDNFPSSVLRDRFVSDVTQAVGCIHMTVRSLHDYLDEKASNGNGLLKKSIRSHPHSTPIFHYLWMLASLDVGS